jgi:sec-independent protein translocase protein TatA
VFGSIGAPELILIFLVALLVFGPRKLPDLGRALGRSLSEFRRAASELRSTLEREIAEEPKPAPGAAGPPDSSPAEPPGGSTADGGDARSDPA